MPTSTSPPAASSWPTKPAPTWQHSVCASVSRSRS